VVLVVALVDLALVAVRRAFDLSLADDNLLALTLNVLAVVVTVVVVVADQARSVDGMGDAFSDALDTTAERVVLAVVTVVAHITLEPRVLDGSSGSSLGDANFGRAGRELGGRTSEAGFLAVALLGDAEAVLGGAEGTGGLAIATLGGVEGG